jgi:hypothetical protein
VDYATKLLEELGIPATFPNKTSVAEAIAAVVKQHGKSSAAAFEFLLAAAKRAQDEGTEVNKFWFEDARWRSTVAPRRKGEKPRPCDAQFVGARPQFKECPFHQCDGSGWWIDLETRSRVDCECRGLVPNEVQQSAPASLCEVGQ